MLIDEMVNAVENYDGYIEVSINCEQMSVGMIISDDKCVFLNSDILEIDNGQNAFKIPYINEYEIYYYESDLGDEYDLVNGNTRVTLLLIA